MAFLKFLSKEEKPEALKNEIASIKAEVLAGVKKGGSIERAVKSVKIQQVKKSMPKKMKITPTPKISRGPVFNKPISTAANSKNLVIVDYSLKDKSSLDKVKFVHSLEGRGNSAGLLGEIGARKAGRGSIIVPAESLEKLKDFLEKQRVPWSKEELQAAA